VDSCQRGVDHSHELPDEEMQAAVYAQYSSDPKILQEADVIIIAVPTPVDSAHIPDFAPLIGASNSALTPATANARSPPSSRWSQVIRPPRWKK
jgi:UDP-N-acetyl-D-galactosamine dehydrogenase